MQFLGSTSSPITLSVWRAWAPAKLKFFAWLLSINRRLTADRLMARQWPNCYFCQLFRRNLETTAHLGVHVVPTVMGGSVAQVRYCGFQPRQLAACRDFGRVA